MKQVVHAACPHDCPDACGVLITVEDGRATKIQGDPGHPVTQGFLCAKVAKYLDRVYSQDRVLYPVRRVGAKGPRAADATEAGRSARSTRSCSTPRRGFALGQRGAAVSSFSDQPSRRISWEQSPHESATGLR